MQGWSEEHEKSHEKTLNLGVLAGVPVPLALRAEVQEVLRLIQDAMRISGTFTVAIEAARSRFGYLNQSVLAKAFRGELVPQDPNDEPASTLLARIKADQAAKGVSTRRGRGRAVRSAE
jgi:type I restriction enzyme, S subunit